LVAVCERVLPTRFVPGRCMRQIMNSKKNDVAEHPAVFSHVGILVNEPPGPSRIARYLVIQLSPDCRTISDSFTVPQPPLFYRDRSSEAITVSDLRDLGASTGRAGLSFRSATVIRWRETPRG